MLFFPQQNSQANGGRFSTPACLDGVTYVGRKRDDLCTTIQEAVNFRSNDVCAANYDASLSSFTVIGKGPLFPLLL